MKKRTYGTGTYRQLPSGKWLLEYRPKWALRRQSTTVEAKNDKAAERQLSDWVTKLDKQEGPLVTVSIADLIALHKDDMVLNNREATNILDTQRKAKKHLGSFFAKHDFTVPLKRADIKRYKTARKTAAASAGTINRELAWLHRCLVLGNENELISVAIPKIEKFDESPYVRTGVVDDAGYYAILRNLPRHAQAVWCIAFRTGIRKGETLKLQTAWLQPHWNKMEPYIEVPGYDDKGNRITKSGKPHVIPLWHSEMRSLLDMVLSDPTRDPKCPYLFQYRGRRLKSIRTAFEQARKSAGLDGDGEGASKIIFHDTRRSAVTRMDELGIDRDEAMEITGHLTESMYQRYRIGKASRAVATGRKLNEACQFANKFANAPNEAEAEVVN